MDEQTDKYWIRIQDDPIDVEEASNFLRTDAAGAVDLFLGTTRRWTDGRETTRLVYECYRAMALKEMRRLVEACADRWPVEKTCLIHREGEVPVREISVLVGVATPHRRDAFEATRYLIDELKERAPIWKREIFADGSTEWVEGNLPSTINQER